MLTVVVARFSSDDSTIRYVRYFWFCGWHHVFILCGQWVGIKYDIMFHRVHMLAVYQTTLLCFVEFARWWHGGEVCCRQLPCC